MFWRTRIIASLLLTVALCSGCDSLGHRSDGSAVPATPATGDGGLLLHTGSIQLGPGLGQNAYSWQGGPHPGL